MNPFLQFLMQLLRRYQTQGHPSGGSRGTPYGGYPGGLPRGYQMRGHLGLTAPMEGTPQAIAARQWLWNNFWGNNPGGGNPSGSGPFQSPDQGVQIERSDQPGRPVGPALGMGNRPNAFNYREVDPNAQLSRMDELFSGEGRTPGTGGGGAGGYAIPLV